MTTTSGRGGEKFDSRGPGEGGGNSTAGARGKGVEIQYPGVCVGGGGCVAGCRVGGLDNFSL